MGNPTRSFIYLFVLVALVSVVVMSTRLDSTSLAQSPSDQRVEIVIRDYAFEVMRPAPVQPGLPTVLILRNQDIVRHGFTSQMLMGMLVHGEGEGVGTYGKGVEGFYIDPGKTLVIRFTNDRPGKYAFRCDLHPNMKGELYALEVPTA
jgi:plastocyanin